MTEKMIRSESQKFLEYKQHMRDSGMVSREEAARIHPSECLDVNQAFGFVSDCEELFEGVEKMDELMNRMLDWACVFADRKDIACIKAAKQRLEDMKNVVYQTYKYADK